MLYATTTVLQALAAILAIGIARRRSDHWPPALFLGAMVSANAARWVLRSLVIFPAQALEPGAPLHGLARAAGHIDQALFLAWPAGIVALTLAVFSGRRPWLVAIGWALAVAALVLTYPSIRGTATRPLYLAAELAAVLASIGLVLQWAWRRQPMTLPRLSALFVVGIDCGTLIGPYAGNPFATWELAQAMYSVLYVLLIAIQGGAIWGSSRPSRSQ
jgi:hypothetical protein